MVPLQGRVFYTGIKGALAIITTKKIKALYFLYPLQLRID